VSDGSTTVFSHSVASGEPTADGIVLWTRADADRDVKLAWELARDEAFDDLAASGTTVASPEHDGCVRVIVDGLEPSTTYRFRFARDGDISPTGRTRTLPAGNVDGLRFAVFSCVKYSAGYFNALGRIADRDDLELAEHVARFVDTLLRRSDGVREDGAWAVRRGTHTLEPVDDAAERLSSSSRG